MNTATTGSALSRLRAKTDRQLAILARRELDRCLVFARAGRHCDAQRSVATAKTLLDLIALPGQEAAGLEREMAEIRRTLTRCAASAA